MSAKKKRYMGQTVGNCSLNNTCIVPVIHLPYIKVLINLNCSSHKVKCFVCSFSIDLIQSQGLPMSSHFLKSPNNPTKFLKTLDSDAYSCKLLVHLLNWHLLASPVR